MAAEGRSSDAGWSGERSHASRQPPGRREGARRRGFTVLVTDECA
jgi:hypothetical protein